MRKVSLLTVAAMLLFAIGALGQSSLRITNGPNIQWVRGGNAQIAWSTDQPSAGQDIVRLGTDPNNLSETIVARQDRQERNRNFNHMAQLVNLQPGRTYFFQIQSQGSQGVLTSQIGSFVAGSGQQSAPVQVMYPYNGAVNQGAYNPYQSPNQGSYNQGSYNQGSNQGSYGQSSQTSVGNSGGLRINNGPNVEDTSGTTAQIAWSTNMPGHSVVHYGTNPSDLSKTLNDQVGKNTPEANGSYNHRIRISGLKPNTTYYFVVETNGVKSTPQQFRTSGS